MLDYRLFKEINTLFESGRHEEARHLLMEVQSRSIALRDEISMLKIRLKTMEDALHLARSLYTECGLYWLRTSGVTLGPFCPRCYESEGALVGLERLARGGNGLRCPYCHSVHQSVLPAAANGGTGRQARILPFAR